MKNAASPTKNANTNEGIQDALTPRDSKYKYCCDTCLYTLKKPEGRNVCIKHGPVSSLLFTTLFIQPIYIYIYIYI